MKGLMRALRFYARKSTSFSQVVSAVRFSNFLSADRNSRCLATCSKILKERQYRPRRAVLYVPGNDERKLQKIASLNVDCAVMDCEDGVAINRKVEARKTIAKMLDELEFGKTECVVRVNAVSSGLMEEDFKEIFTAKTLPETIMVPKVNDMQELNARNTEKFYSLVNGLDQVTKILSSALKDRPIETKIGLIIFVESAIGLLNLRDVCQIGMETSLRSSTFQLEGVVFGSDDFCADIGAKRSSDAAELVYARQKVVTIAKAFRLQAIDMVQIDYKDHESLRQQSVLGASMGFTGKQVIHPSQIHIVHEAFSPSAEQIDWATELIKAFDQHQATGKGAFTFRGNMIDMPLLLQAQNIVQLAKAVKS